MRSTIAMSIDGVLRDMNGGHLIVSGKELYFTLSQAYRIILLSEALELSKEDYWLTMNGLREHADVVIARVEDLGTESDELILRQVNKLQADGYNVMFVMTADPISATTLLSDGHRVFGVFQPQYLAPEWSPDTGDGKRSWDDLKAQLMKQQILKAADTRTDEEAR